MLRIKEKGYNFEQSPIRMKGDTKNKSRNPCPKLNTWYFEDGTRNRDMKTVKSVPWPLLSLPVGGWTSLISDH